MIVSEKQLQEFAKMIATNEAFPDVIERIQQRLFGRWLDGKAEEREIIGDISDNLRLFIKEINSLHESIDEERSINDEEEK